MFDYVHPITIKVTFSFLEYILVCIKSARFIHTFRKRVPCPFLATTTHRLLKYFLTFLNLHQHVKNQLSLTIHHVTRVAATIFDHTHPNIFPSTLNFSCQHAKK